MIYIFDRSERIVGLLLSGSDRGHRNVYFDDLHTEDLTTGAETFSFSSIVDRKTSNFLQAGNYVGFTKGNSFRLFQIIETTEEKEDVIIKNIYAETVGLELTHSIYNGGNMASVNIERFLKNVLQDTHWEVGEIDNNLVLTLALEIEPSEVYTLIQENIGYFGAEIRFRVEIDNNRIVGRYVDAFAERGKNFGKRLEIRRDILKTSRKIDLSNYATKLIGIGKNGLTFKDVTIQGIDKPLGEDFIINEEAFETLNDKGSHITKKFEFDTEDAYELLRQTKKALDEMSKPQITYEVDTNVLDFTDIEIGDTVLIHDYDFEPALSISARIGALETSKTDKYKNKATLTNFKEVKSKIPTISQRDIDKSVSKVETNLNEFKVDIKTETSEIRQVADKVHWIIDEGTDQANMQLTNDATKTFNRDLNLDQKVNFIDLSTNGKTSIHGGNIQTQSITADKIDVNNLSVKGELISGQINGVDGIKFANGAVISRFESFIPGTYGIRISAIEIDLGDRVNILNPNVYNDVKGYKSKGSIDTTWTISNNGDIDCNTLTSRGTIKGMNNISLTRGNVFIPNLNVNTVSDHLTMGNGIIAGTDVGGFHFINKGKPTSIAMSTGDLALPQGGYGTTECNYIRLGMGIVGVPNDGTVHFLTADARATKIFASNVVTTYSLDSIKSKATKSVFDTINSIDVVETDEGLRLLDKTKSVKDNNIMSTYINEENKEEQVELDITSIVSTLWKSNQDLIKENQELRDRLKLIEEKLDTL